MRAPFVLVSLAAILLAGPLAAQQRNPWDGLLRPEPTFPPQQQRPPQGVPDIAAPPLPGPDRPAQRSKGAAKGQPAEAVPERPPAARVANPTAVFSGLDKITGRIFPFDAAVGETVQFGALQVTPRACYTRPPTEPQNTTGFVEVDEITLDAKVRRIFSGWMFAASPGLNAVEHAIYDVWLVDCKQGPPDLAQPEPERRAPQG